MRAIKRARYKACAQKSVRVIKRAHTELFFEYVRNYLEQNSQQSSNETFFGDFETLWILILQREKMSVTQQEIFTL